MCGVHCVGDLWLSVDMPGASGSGAHDQVSIDVGASVRLWVGRGVLGRCFIMLVSVVGVGGGLVSPG